MSIPTEHAVKSIIGSFELRIREILEGAWEDWLLEPNKSIKSARTRASIVFDFIKHRAITEFDGDPLITALPRGQTIQFLLKDEVLIRFKKANASGLGSNIETTAVLRFVDPQLMIPDLLPEILRVEVCYHLDALATKMEILTVGARDRKRRIWAYEVARPANSDVLSFELKPATSPSSGVEIRPRAKPAASEADKEE
ncbi:hypothetical protein HB779_07085 [Phyllobacterium sp. 628]|uniref:hypothetical protein n=1 Tax=Phyllobacterium sp. 628 TaxID=2718938 RepID=UPI0016628A29|nr:hypothetical protein [Phyllobacterium sp. 628]QND51689.1 hypothetical protein HB779_07085 [Phyllobacterium sp. 628]